MLIFLVTHADIEMAIGYWQKATVFYSTGPQSSKQSFAGVAGIESSLVIRLENMSLERVCLVANLVVPIHFCLPVISKSEINSIGWSASVTLKSPGPSRALHPQFWHSSPESLCTTSDVWQTSYYIWVCSVETCEDILGEPLTAGASSVLIVDPGQVHNGPAKKPHGH